MTEAETALDQATLALSNAINAWGKALLAHQAEVIARITGAPVPLPVTAARDPAGHPEPPPSPPVVAAPVAAAPSPSVMAGLDPATHPVPVEAVAPIGRPIQPPPDNGGGQPMDSALPLSRGLLQRTPARKALLEAMLREVPRLALKDIAAALNDVRPGADITTSNVAVWITELTRGRARQRREAEEVNPVPAPVASPLALDPAPPVPVLPAPPPAAPAPRTMADAMAEVVEVGPAEYLRREGARLAAAPSPAAVARPPRLAAIPSPARPVPAFRSDPIVADDSYIRSWAAQRGLPQDRTLDMRAINEKAAALGLRPFANPSDRKPFRLGATG